MNSILIVALCALLFSTANSQNYRECDGNDKCIAINKCTRVTKAYQNMTPEMQKELLTYLRDNKQCGWEGIYPKICCPNEPELSDNQVGCGVADTLSEESTDLYNPLNYPWVALLEYSTEKGSEYRCTGVLINDRYVLTAAACLDPEEPFMVHFNKNSPYDESKYVKLMTIKRVIKHEKFTSDRDNFASNSYDIGLIELDGSVSINPICLPKKQIEPISQYVAVGFGTDVCNRKARDLPKRILTLEPVDKETCGELGNDDSICAKTKPKSSIHYIDVGGALSDNRNGIVTLKGIHSPPIACTNKFAESYIYTDVRLYLKWIEENAI